MHEFAVESNKQMLKYFRDCNTHIFTHIDISKRPTEKTKRLSEISVQNEKRYGFTYTKAQLWDLKPFNVNTFWSIGMPDPFPDESTVIEKDNQLLGNEPLKIGKLIYP